MMTPAPETTLLILLGAHEYPHWPELASRSFERSATEIRAYFTDPYGFALPQANLLDLFNDPAGPSDIISRISDFLRKPRNPVRDVILCFIGHGDLISGNAEYHLSLQSTRKEHPKVSALRVSDLAEGLKDPARHLRLLLILDCCSAAAAASHFQPSGISGAFAAENKDASPEKGVALLCASSRFAPARIDETTGYTLFSGALIEALRNGDPEREERLSLAQVGELVRFLLHKRGAEAPRPEVHSPSQRQGDVAAVPIFPNPAARRKPRIPFLENMFSHFRSNQLVPLFSQDGMAQNIRYLLDYAESQFGKNNVIRLEPLSGDVSPAEYFAELFDQCRITGSGENARAFRRCIENRLVDSEDLLLFITRFEYGNSACGVELANVLRSLVSLNRNLHVLIMGGERLADLYFVPGNPLSALRGSEPAWWEELNVEDVQLFCPDTNLSGETAKAILNVSGGHPVLLHTCIRHLRSHPETDESGLTEFIKRSDYLWSRFLTVSSDETAKQRLLGLLQQEIVFNYMPYIRDPFIRQLFWMNLIKRSRNGRHLVWRSDAVREAGKMVCGDN